MKTKQNCWTCRHSKDWSITPTGRPRANMGGKCTYQVTLPVLPRCLVLYESRIAVWPDHGATCPVWEAKL